MSHMASTLRSWRPALLAALLLANSARSERGGTGEVISRQSVISAHFVHRNMSANMTGNSTTAEVHRDTSANVTGNSTTAAADSPATAANSTAQADAPETVASTNQVAKLPKANKPQTSDLSDMEKQKARLQEALTLKTQALADAREQRSQLQMKVWNVSLALRRLREDKEENDRKISWANIAMLGIYSAHEAQVQEAKYALACLAYNNCGPVAPTTTTIPPLSTSLTFAPDTGDDDDSLDNASRAITSPPTPSPTPEPKPQAVKVFVGKKKVAEVNTTNTSKSVSVVVERSGKLVTQKVVHKHGEEGEDEDDDETPPVDKDEEVQGDSEAGSSSTPNATEGTPGGESSETVPITNASSETVPITNASSETVPITNASSETVPITNASSETAPITNASSETAPITNASSETAPITNVSSETAPITNVSSETVPITNATGRGEAAHQTSGNGTSTESDDKAAGHLVQHDKLDQAEIDSGHPNLDGNWSHVVFEEPRIEEIKGTNIYWSSSNATPFRWIDDSIHLDMPDGETYIASLRNNTLIWSDGDIWTKQ